MALKHAAILGLSASQAAAFFLMPCWPVSIQRLDPIVQPGKVSYHVHQIAGGNAFAPVMDYNKTQAADCTTCFVNQDHSNYWIPRLYVKVDGGYEPVDQVGSASMYYFNEASRLGPGETVEPFPEGLRMFAGDPDKRSEGSTMEDQSINYKCLNYAGAPTDSKGFPDHDCPDGFRAEVTYPSCWDGKNIDSDDHKSHMAYPLGTFESGACPSTHPHHMVTLKVEFIFDTHKHADKWKDGKQPFVWSNGDDTGHGLHADYVMGWPYDLLSAAVEQCHDIYGVLDNCAPFAGMLPAKDNSYVNPGTCKVQDYVNEQIDGTLGALPGCHPVQSGKSEEDDGDCGDSASLVGGEWGDAAGGSAMSPPSGSNGAGYESTDKAASPAATATTPPVAMGPAGNQGGNIVTEYDILTVTTYVTEGEAPAATGWSDAQWKRGAADYLHERRHRHGRRHGDMI